MQTILDVQNLNVRLSTPNGVVHAVRDWSLEVMKGELLCIVGESGCGKSMTSFALMNLLPRNAKRTADRIMFQGKDLAKETKYQREQVVGNHMSMIFQEPMTSLNPVFTIENQLIEGYMHHHKASYHVARERALYLLNRTGIQDAEARLKQYPHQLSGGLRQRVMIAMALMCNPSLIIADEPTTALDVTIQAQILHLIRELQTELETSLIFITHDLGVVSRIADRVAVMYAGEIIEMTDTQSLFEKPRHPYTQGLLACIPSQSKKTGSSRLQAIPGVVPSLMGDLSGCMFRNRCPHAQPSCEQPQTLEQKAPQHWVRCMWVQKEV